MRRRSKKLMNRIVTVEIRNNAYIIAWVYTLAIATNTIQLKCDHLRERERGRELTQHNNNIFSCKKELRE